MKIGRVVRMALVLLGALACGERTETKPPPARVEPPPRLTIEDVSIGRTAAVGQQGEDFLAGEPVFLRVQVAGTPAGQAVEVVWQSLAGERVASQRKPAERGTLAFQAPDTGAWKAGRYEAAVLLDGEEFAVEPFQIVEPQRSFASGEAPFVRRTVFYGTDRAETGSREPESFFGNGRSGSGLRFGVCEVTIPRDHRLGAIERPTIWKLEIRPDPEKHMILGVPTPLPKAAFLARVRSAVQGSREKEILVFVHGFNVPFADAVLRTAQLAYDLGFDGAPITYSWPSQASLSLTGYRTDAKNAAWTAPHLEQFLTELAARSNARRIHLIAHSMGNRPLTAALRQIAARMAPSSKPLFDHVVLTAPDLDLGAFRQIAAQIAKPARRATLYASSRDRALQFSRRVNGNPRAGDSGEDIVVLRGLDTIDVSKIDTSLVGHSYYGDNRSVVADLFGLIHDRKPPGDRFGLRARAKGGLPYWAFQP